MGLKVKGPNGEWKETGGALKVIKVDEGGASVVPLTVTENGTYNSPKKTVTEVWGDNTEYDFLADGTIPYNVKKAENLVVPSDIETVAPKGTFTVTLATGEKESMDLEQLGYEFYADLGFGCTIGCQGVLWVVDATALNAMFGVNVIENNTVYVTNAYKEISEDITEVSFSTFGNEPADGYLPVVVDVQPKLNDGYATITENGTTEVLPWDGNDGLRKVTVTVNYDNKELESLIDGTITEVVVKNNDRIRHYCFYNCDKLERVIFEGNLVIIYASAFCGCTKLTNVRGIKKDNYISASNMIGERAFERCALAGEYTIHSSQIHTFAFGGCGLLTGVTIDMNTPYSWCRVYSNAFWNCTSLENVTIKGNLWQDDLSECYIDSNAFQGCFSLKTLTIDCNLVFPLQISTNLHLPSSLQAIYVRADQVEAYKAAAYWAYYADKIFAIEE